jgi:hypothetical protein
MLTETEVDSKENPLDIGILFANPLRTMIESLGGNFRGTMADNLRKPEHWVDELREKHECGGYRNPITISIAHEDRSLTLLSPFPLAQAKVLSTTISGSGELLYLIAKEPQEWYEPPFSGILIVARRREADRYEVFVWHSLFPWAIERLGLDDTTDS